MLSRSEDQEEALVRLLRPAADHQADQGQAVLPAAADLGSRHRQETGHQVPILHLPGVGVAVQVVPPAPPPRPRQAVPHPPPEQAAPGAPLGLPRRPPRTAVRLVEEERRRPRVGHALFHLGSASHRLLC